MRCSEFNNLINYIKTHPTDAHRLAEALEPFLPIIQCCETLGERSEGNAANQSITKLSPCETPGEEHVEAAGCIWLKAKDVGERLGQSACWVKERISLLPPDMVAKSKSGRGKPAWMFHPRVINLLNEYR